MDAASTPSRRRDTLVDHEESTAKVPGYALRLAQDLARSKAAADSQAFLHATPRSGLHPVVPPPRLKIAVPVIPHDEDDGDDDATSKHPPCVRLIADSLRVNDDVEDDDDTDQHTLRMASVPNAPAASPVTAPIALPVGFPAACAPPANENERPLSELLQEPPLEHRPAEPIEPNPSGSPEAEPELVPAGLETRTGRRASGFYWAASIAAVVAGCAMTSALMQTRLPGRAPHVFVPTRVASCIGDLARPVSPASVSVPVVRRGELPAPAGRTALRHARAALRPPMQANGIVRDLPF